MNDLSKTAHNDLKLTASSFRPASVADQETASLAEAEPDAASDTDLQRPSDLTPGPESSVPNEPEASDAEGANLISEPKAGTAAHHAAEEATNQAPGPDPEKGPAARDEATEAKPGDRPRAEREETFRLVREFMDAHKIVVRFDGQCHVASGPLVAESPAQIDAVLHREEIDATWLLDEFMMETKANGLQIKKGDAQRAIGKALRRAKKHRRKKIMKPLLEQLAPSEQVAAQEAWKRLSSIFEIASELCTAILAHFIWQVKQKQLNRPVLHHLMPVVVSAMQGSGKTTFAHKFLSPLEEMATGPVLLTDFADSRNRDLFRYAALIIDDVGKIPANLVPTLKSLVTAERFRRRILGTSMSGGVSQQSTLFGTANNPIEELIPDPTGHRRFASLPFRNGAIEKDGDPEVWRIVSETDYVLLWRSVDAFAPSPIEACLQALFAYQAASAPVDPLKSWLAGLDLSSEAFLRIKTREGVGATELYEMYLRDTGADISQTRFGIAVKRHLSDPAVPFERAVRTAQGRYYALRLATKPSTGIQ